MTANTAPRTLVDGLLFPEGPRWHDGRLWFSDIYAGAVLSVDLYGKVHAVASVEARPSGLGWLADGRLLVVSMRDRRVLRLDPRGLVIHADLSSLVTGNLNDMVVDQNGRAYVGNFGMGYGEGTAPEPTNLICIEPDGEAHEVARDLLFPNGVVITPDGGQLLLAEGFAHRITAFTRRPDGGLVDRTVFADLAGEIPDGIALDREGGVWVALPLQQQFIRVVEGGIVTDRIDVAPSGAFACALGGEDRRTLFMCVSLGSQSEIQAGRSRGSVLYAPVDVPGAGWP